MRKDLDVHLLKMRSLQNAEMMTKIEAVRNMTMSPLRQIAALIQTRLSDASCLKERRILIT
jgi:hypothetical protein